MRRVVSQVVHACLQTQNALRQPKQLLPLLLPPSGTILRSGTLPLTSPPSGIGRQTEPFYFKTDGVLGQPSDYAAKPTAQAERLAAAG